LDAVKTQTPVAAGRDVAKVRTTSQIRPVSRSTRGLYDRDGWADAAAWLQTRKGRDWRPLADTAIAAQIGYTQARGWRPRTRSTDFYKESAMLWLEADTLIRSTTHGAKSLDDFCRLFYGRMQHRRRDALKG
jgi:predicted metalloprotease with PDZ domain